MSDPAARAILEKALARGIVSSGAAHETLRRLDDLAAKGTPRGVIELLHEVAGIDVRLLAGLDDCSLVGRTLGNFVIRSKIGEGGMGAVYRATQTSLGRTIALKVLDPSLAMRAELAERFRREARTAAKLDHPHVVQPIDFGEDAGFLYFAMELMEGGSAASRLAERGRFSERAALEVAAGVASALEYAEGQGIVHRDIKPDNILFSKHGTPKLADLGLVLERSGTKLTEPGMAMGTPHYMSPEQAMGHRDLDVRSDIYALGATVYELLTGRPPFNGTTPAAVLTQHVSSPMPPVRALVPEVSPSTDALIARMCAKKREMRFSGGLELRKALEAALSHSRDADTERSLAAPIRSSDACDSGDGDSTASEITRVSFRPLDAPPLRSRPLARALGAAAALAFVASIVLGIRALVSARSRVDASAEADAASEIRELLLSRRGADDAYSFKPSVPGDAWTTAQALVGLAVGPDPPVEVYPKLLARIESEALYGTSGAHELLGWRFLPAADNLGCAEPSAWVAIAFAVTGERTPASAGRRERVRSFLSSIMEPDGGVPSLPALGHPTVRTSGTVLALIALTALDARAGRDADADPILRACGWLGEHYDGSARRHAWFPNPKEFQGNRRIVEGLSECVVWSLLEAGAALERHGRRLPEKARAAIDDFARSAPFDDLPQDLLGQSLGEDYFFDFPPDARSSIRPVRWVSAAWRLLAARRLALAGAPRARKWAIRSERLRARLPELSRALRQAPTFQVAECSLALNLVRGRPANDPRSGSLYRQLLEGP